MIGRLLARRYEIVERLGSGGWATVYRGRDRLLGRPVAIKVLRDLLAADAEFVHRFRREAQAAASLSHPNVVSIYDVGRDGETHFIVLEYVDGVTLKQRIDREGPLPFGAAARVACQILEALDHAHQNGIVHRDIKPHNVLLTRQGRVKVTDFGIARAPAAETLTHAGSIVGSAHYLSPEQARGGHAGVESDLYSTGIVLYEMVTGRVPFTGDSPIAVALQHIQSEPPPLAGEGAEPPARLAAIVHRAILKDPAQRYRSAADMLAELNDFLATVPAAEQSLPCPARAAAEAFRPARTALAAAAAGGVAFPAPGLGRADPVRLEEDADPSEDIEATRQAAPRRRPQPRPGVAWRMWAAMASVVLMGFLTAAGIRALRDWFDVPEVRVPRVVGEPLTRAQQILNSQNLTYSVKEQISSDRPAGEVLSQRPEPGAIVRVEREVELTVSTGQEFVRVPDLTGRTVADAQQLLEEEHGLRIGQRFDRFDSAVSPDRIFDQSPRPGILVARGSLVDVYVNTGKRSVIMPSLVGLTRAEAARRLRELRLEAEFREGEDPRYAPGLVIAQSDALGTRLLEGERVTLTINRQAGKRHTLEVPVPKAPGAVQVVVRVTDQRGAQTVYDRYHPPGTLARIEFTWTGEAGTYEVFGNGLQIGGGPLR